MRKIHLFAVLVALVMGAFGATADAYAGCTAAGQGNPTYVDGSMRIYGGIQCTTNNGSHYQARTYMQGNNGGWHIVAGPATKDYYSPGTNYFNVVPYYFSCSPLVPQDSQVRSKIVVENMVTGSIDIGYSGAVARPSNCQ
jgi:hypothetical protein